MKVIYNPYGNIDWGTCVRVKAVSHEHVYDQSTVRRMYDRGIRYFGHVHYLPAVPRYPLSDFRGIYEDWCYFDASNFYKNGDRQTHPSFTAVEARKRVPSDPIDSATFASLYGSYLIGNFRSQGLTVAYLDTNKDNRWTQLIADPSDYNSWEECCEDENAWVDRTWEDVDENLVKNTKTLYGEIPTFTSAASASEYNGKIVDIAFSGDGLEHNTNDIPQLPNAEHPVFSGLGHFNILGTENSDAGWSFGAPNDWRAEDVHRLHNINDIGTMFPTSSSFYDGKLFGTVNHAPHNAGFKSLQSKYPYFKGYEVYNNGMQRSDWETYLRVFHNTLNLGLTIYALSVVDWQGDYGGGSDVDRGTNVLYMTPDYASKTVSQKSEMGMDAYVNGSFVASGYGIHYIKDFSINPNSRKVHFKVDSPATTISIIFNGVYNTFENVSEVELKIPYGTTNVSAEAWFGESGVGIWKSDTKMADKTDFLITQAIIIENIQENNSVLKMFALDN